MLRRIALAACALVLPLASAATAGASAARVTAEQRQGAQGVHQASISFNGALDSLRIPHIWRDYGPGCHTPANFEREITATLGVLAAGFAHPPAAPDPFSYMSIQPSFAIWGWQITADRRRALEFMRVERVSARSVTLVGSGLTTVTTPPLFRGIRRVALSNATTASARPSRSGRITFRVDLGAPDTEQEYNAGAGTTQTSRTVEFAPGPAGGCSPGRIRRPATGRRC